MRRAARGNYRQRIRACHPEQVMADKSGRHTPGTSHEHIGQIERVLTRGKQRSKHQIGGRARSCDLKDSSRALYH